MLDVTNLTVGYGRRTVLDRLQFSVQPGRLVAILGRNGCGKSTLLSCLCGQLQPQSGAICWNGTNLRTLKPDARAQILAYLPQNTPAPNLTVAELSACGRAPWQGWGRRLSAEDRFLVQSAMEQAGISELADRPLPQLSGGERQRAWLAMTLAQDTPLLLLDEPTTYLDPAQQFQFLETLRTLCRQGKTVLSVLHDLPMALRYADQVLLLDGGHCVYNGPPDHSISALEQVFQLHARQLDGHLVLEQRP